LTGDDLFSPKVEGYLEEQNALRRDVPQEVQRPLIMRILYSSYFYLSLAGCLGALAAWGLIEPHLIEPHLLNEDRPADGQLLLVLMLFPTVAAGIGLFLGAAEGIITRNFTRALLTSVVGLAMGFGGGLVALIPVGIVFSIMRNIALSVGPPPGPGQMLKGLGLGIFIMGRGAAWSLAAIPAGLGQGIALREKKVIINGLLGAVLGGLLGGLLFDPIDFLLKNPNSAAASRAVGFGTIGVMVGLFVGLVEQWTKTAWLMMKAGPLAGKQFVIYRNPTVIGSSPKADIYVFKDPDIEPKHALIHNRGGRYEIEDCGSKDGTYVNGVAVSSRILQPGDQIVVGKTMLEFSLRDAQ
jgi:hypothetical protein